MRTFICTFIIGLVLAANALAAEPLPHCVASIVNIQEDTFEAEIRASYPAVTDERINAVVRTWVQDSLREFKLTLAKDDFNPANWKYMLDIGPTLSSIPGRVLGMKFQVMYFTGGAHPNHFVTCFNFDLENGRDLELGELFTDLHGALKIIAEATRKQVRPELGEQVDEKWFLDGTAATENNYQHFTLAPEGITFYFPPYQMAAYVFGQQQATVAWDRLEKQFSPHLSKLLGQ